MSRFPIALFALVAVSCSNQVPHRARVKQAPLCWKAGMVGKGDRLQGVGTVFYNPDGPLVLGALRCKRLSFSLTFADNNLEQSTLMEMRAKSTGDAFGGQFYLAQFEGVVVGDGTDGSHFRIQRLHIVRPVAKEAAFTDKA